MVFTSVHRPLREYTRALFDAGFLIEDLREVPEPPEETVDRRKRWQRLPLFLHIRAVKRAESRSM
jgi:hypothetical protein